MRIQLPAAARNPVSVIGGAIATATGFSFLVLLSLQFLGYLTNPYIGLVIYIAIPALFLMGLLLIPIGGWWNARRLARGEIAEWPVIDLRQPHQRSVVFAVLFLTFVNVLIVSVATYGGVHRMESVEFCGTTCHTVMQPEYVGHQTGSHANVTCVQCHVGPGVGPLVQSKLSGLHQVWTVVSGRVPRPVPPPDTLISPARVTCTQCHAPARNVGDRLRVIREYANDEKNTETVTMLRMHVGGGNPALGVGSGIHWHANLANRIEYVPGPDPKVIPYVRVTDMKGTVREYVAKGADAKALASADRRLMDCTDCHNRPAHTFTAEATRAVDNAMAADEIPRGLPFIRREAVAAVSETYASREAGLAAIERRLGAFLRGRSVAEADVTRAVTGTQAVWSRNVFPDMRVTWGTYANHLGHVDTPGCFRCHDDEHKSADGRVISQECDLCHAIE